MADGSRVEQEGQEIVERLGGRWTVRGGMCRCPAHEDRTPSLSVRPGRSRLLFHCFAGCGASQVLDALRSAGLLDPQGKNISEPSRNGSESALGSAAERLWSEARPVRGSLAEAYLESRGIACDSPQLRFHPNAPHGPRPVTVFRSALIAAVRDECGLVAVHRTFLERRRGQSAPVATMKRSLGRLGSGAVRLGDPGQKLGLAEGIESALSARLLFGFPCWATLGSERFALVRIPARVLELHLFLDHDSGGRRAEALARDAFAHVARIETHYPPGAGQDWNDILGQSAARDSG